MTGTGVVRETPAPLRTPLVRDGACWIKAEGCQRARSAKYRLVHSRVGGAIRSGEISHATTLVEVTSGSTGVALALVGRLLGRTVELHAYRTIAPSKRRAIEEEEGRLVLHDPDVSVAQLLAGVRRKVAEGGYWHLDQYTRESTAQAYEPLGLEILSQLGHAGAPSPRAFICPVGSGGLIQGVGTVLRREIPGIRVIAVEPDRGQAIDGIRNTELFHMGESDPYDRSFPDEVVRVPCPESRVTVRSILLGESASAACAVAAARDRGPTLVLAPD